MATRCRGSHVVLADPDSGFPHGLSTACDADSALPDLTGLFALLGRGTCSFTEKIANAQGAGAIGVILVQNIDQGAFVASHSGAEPKPTIPVVMVSLSDGMKIADHDGVRVTLDARAVYRQVPGASNLIASFSSWGPTERNLLIKADVVAQADPSARSPATPV